MDCYSHHCIASLFSSLICLNLEAKCPSIITTIHIFIFAEVARWFSTLAANVQAACKFESHLLPAKFITSNKVSPLDNLLKTLPSVPCALNKLSFQGDKLSGTHKKEASKNKLSQSRWSKSHYIIQPEVLTVAFLAPTCQLKGLSTVT